MRKFLRSFVMLALLAVPFVTQAQVTCESGYQFTVANAESSTTTTGYFPGYAYYKYSYSEVIIPAGSIELASFEVKALEFKTNSTTNGTYFDNCNVYLCNTTAGDLSSGFVQDMSNFVLVYSGSLNYSTVGWQTIVFNQGTFTWDGMSNILVAVHRNHGSYGSSGNYFDAYNAGANLGRYIYQDGSQYTPGSISGGTATSTVPLYRLVGCGTPLSCMGVSNLAVSNITPTTATLTWTDGVNTGATYTVMNGTEVLATGVTGTSYNVTGLVGNTSYTLSVITNCSGSDNSNPKTVSFTTPCDYEAFPFVETFDVSINTNACWAGATGVTAAEVFAGASLSLGTASQWTYSSTTNNGFINEYRANIYGTSCKRWLITPIIDLTSAASAQLTFDAAFTVYTSSSNAPATGFESNSSQAFMVLISTDGGQTWLESNATKWQNEGGDYTLASLASSSYIEQTINLNQYLGQAVRIAFYAQSTTSGGDNNIHIDNIVVDVVPTCFKVTNLAVSNITDASATLTWTDAINSGASYTIYNGDEVVATVPAGTYTYDITGLTALTNYEFSVVANCAADDASRATSVSFTTSCPAYISLPYTDGFEVYPSGSYQMPYCWQRINDATGTYNYYPYDYTSNVHSGSRCLYFYGSTSTTYATNQMAIMPAVDVTVNPMNNNMVEFWARRSTNAVDLEVGTMSDPTDMSTFTVASSVAINSTTYEQYRVKLYNAPATDAYVAFRVVRGSSAKYVYLDDVTLDTIPAVWPVVAAQVDSVTDGSISLSWTPNPENDAVTYTVYDGATAVATGITETNTTITGLTPNTGYTFAVVAVAGARESAPVEVSGRTDCDYSLVLSLPVSMSFSEAEFNDLYCWSSIYGSADNASANPMTLAIYGEDTVWRFSSFNNASDYNQYLVSPRFSTTEPVKVTFSHVNGGNGNVDQMRVLYFTANAAGDGDTVIEASDWMSADVMTTDSVYLPANATRVAFHYYGNYAYYYYIDNINLSVAPTHNVTFTYLNQENENADWGSAAVDGLAYEGMNATLVSTPGEYKRTAAWYAGAVTDIEGLTPLAVDTNSISFGPVMGDTTVTVYYGYGQFLVAAEPNQVRMGSVEADPVSANSMYDYQSVVTLTAVPSDGFMFKEWLNKEDRAVLFTENPLTIEAIQNYELIARFVIDTFSVDYTAIVLYDDDTFEALPEAGTITGAENGLMFGEVATITAEPAEHYEWSHWATSAEDITSLSADQTLNFRMLGDTVFFPVFTPMHYTVTIENTDTRATYTGAGEYAYGDTVTISVSNVDPNYDWMGWMENGETITTDSVYTFVIDADRTFFGNIPGGINTIIFATNDPDMGSVRIVEVQYEDATVVDYTDSTTLTVTAPYGTRVTVEAQPVMQYAQFNGWSVGNSTNLVETFTIVSDTTVIANFGFQTYNVTLNVLPDALTGTATAEPAAPEYGETVTVTATAADHWVFDHWTDVNGAVVSTDNPYTTDLLFEDLELTANFVRDSHNVVAIVEDATYGTAMVTDADGNEALRFMHTDSATVAFTEDYGYTFAGWSDGTAIVSTDNPYTFEVEDDVELTATVDPIRYNVTVYSGEAQRGSASTSTPTVAYLGTATLANEPNYGYVFDFWANEAGDEIELPLVITQDTTIVAHFTFDQFTVTGAPHEDCVMMGTVAPATGEYDYLSTATLTATANYGYLFSKWVDAAGNELGTAETIDITVEGDSNVFAMFDYEPMDVIVNVNDPLFGTAATTVAAPYFFSQTITVEATAAEHYHFVNWTNANGEDVSTDNPYTFILTEPVELTANFAIDTHTVTLVYNENAVEDIYGDGEYTYGSDVEVGLTPAYGFTFTGWDNGETLNPFTLHVESDTTIEALFTTNQYTVTAEVAAASTGMGTAGGTNTVDYMSYVILTATPATGHDFVNWTNADGEVVSTNPVFSVQATQDTTFYANFKVHAYTVTIASADEERGDVAWSAPTHIEAVNADFTVADGSTTNGYVPVYGLYCDEKQRSQSIYPASMLASIPAGSQINSMKYYVYSGSSANWSTGIFTVKIAETTQENLSTWDNATALTTVYSGTLTANTTDGMTVVFDSPFTYNGGNLLVQFQLDAAVGYTSCYFYGVSQTNGSRSVYGTSYLTATGTARAFLPKVTFNCDYNDVVLEPIEGVTYDDNDPDHIAYVDYQNSIAMEATAEYGYHFENWSNSLDATTSTDNPMTIASVEADVDYTANFAKNQYTITAAVGGDMAGTVAGTATVDYLETVTLTATPDADHRLLRWVNAADEILGNDLTLTVTAERDSVITAVFGYEVYTLTANTEDFEMGGVYVEDPASMGAPVEIFADDFESGIANWTTEGDGTWAAGTGDYSTTTGSHSGTANALIKHSSTGNATKLISPVLDLSAYTSPELNFWFVNRSWGGDIDELNVYYRTSETAAWQSLQNYTSDHATYTEATFALPEPSATYQIAFEMVDSWGYGVAIDDVVISGILAGVAPSLATSYADVDYTTPVNIVATPAEHYHFVGWMNEAGDTVLTNANETITVLGDSTLTALFDGDQMPMTYQVNNAIRGAVEGPAAGEFNTEVTFEAIAAHGYQFDRWDDGYEDNPRTVTVLGTDAENTYKAIFNYQTFDVDVTVENGTLAEELDTRAIYYGTQLTINAVANEHYNQWKGWKDAGGNVVSMDNPYTFIVLEDVSLTGVFEIDTFTVTLAVNDPTMGSFVEDLSGQYTYGTELTAVAQLAGADYHFVNWTDATDAEVATDLEFNFTVEGDVTYTANFGLNQYNIATIATNGTAVWAGYDIAVPTANIAIDGTDSYGDGWNGNSINIKKGGVIIDNFTLETGSSAASYNNAILADEDITFEWVSGGSYSYPDEVSFTINVNGTPVVSLSNLTGTADGTVLYTIPGSEPVYTTVIPEGTTPVDPHTNLTFTATPDAGYNFVNWTTEDGTIVSSTNPTVVEIVSDTTLVANFSTEVYTVVAISTDTVKGTVSPATANLTVEQGALLTATPKYGYVFVNWTDKNGAEISTAAEFTFTDVTMDTVYANFNYDFFDVTVAANDNAWGSVTLNNSTVLTGNFPYGDTVTLRATAADGYYFVNWTNNAGAVVSDQLMCTFIVEADETYTANFADGSTYTITAVADDPVHGQVTGAGTYMAGTTVTLTAVEFPNYFFTEWNDGNTDNPRIITVTADADYTAIYDTVAYNVTVNGEAEAVKYGVTYSVNAADSACRTFNGWSNGTEVVASGNQYTFVVTGDITLTATYSDAISYTAEETVAYCGAYNWNGEDRTTTGDYTYTTTTAAGCDSTITLHLTVSDVMTSTDVQTSCGSFTWIDGNTYTESNNTATFTTTASNGCDSVITLNLTVNNPTGTSTTATECGSYTWNGTDYTTSGTYNYSHTDINGCTVVDTLVLTINQASTQTVTLAACGSHTWNGQTYTASGIYTYTTTNAAGCDSVVTLALTINQPVYSSVTESACDSYIWTNGNGQTYTTSGTYTATISSGAANGCDSIITLNLTVNQGITATVTESACDSYNWNGTDYTTSGTYTWTGTASNGCDSTVTLNLTVNQSVTETVTETVEENLVWNGMTLTTSGTYTWTGVAANGCDSVVTLILTVTGSVIPDTNYYTVYIETVNGGFGTVTGDGTYPEGTVVTLTATPINEDEYEFVAWLINGDTAWTTPEYTFTLVSDTTVTAVFAQLPVYYTVNAIVVDEDGNVNDAMGTVLPAGSHQVEAGTYDTLTAQANPGYHFVRWNNGHNQPTIVILVTGDITLEAIFAADQPATGIDESDMENVTIYSAESTIFVRGAEGKDVSVYDINGRTISSQMGVGETVEFRMAATGVYLVKVGDAPAKRVLVVR